MEASPFGTRRTCEPASLFAQRVSDRLHSVPDRFRDVVLADADARQATVRRAPRYMYKVQHRSEEKTIIESQTQRELDDLSMQEAYAKSD